MKNKDNSEIAPEDPQGGGDLTVIGEGTGSEVSFQIVQDVYNEITGKSEQLNKGYDIPFRVTMEDLRQLHHHVGQLCEQYHVRAENESVTVFYEEDSREVYSSFDRFSISGSSSISPIESVVLKYNFLIVVPKSRRPQSYSLSVRLASRISIVHKMRAEIPPSFFPMLQMRNAMVTVKYVDYVVARNLADGVDRWIKGLPTYPHPKWFRFIRRHSQYLRYLIAYAVGGFGAYLVFKAIPEMIPRTQPDFQSLAQFALVGSLSIFVLYRLGKFLGYQVESALDDADEISYVQLSKGDVKRIGQAKRQNLINFLKGGASAVATVALGVVSSHLADWLVG